MAQLTEKRLEKVAPILDRFRELLVRDRRFSTSSLEDELCEAIGTGYRGLKDFVEDLLRHPDHRHVALYYMQYSNASGPVVEFWGPLADAYGVSSYHADNREAAQESFWHSFFAES